MGGDQLHIGGERAAAFRELVDDLDPRRVLLVGIDVAKASWFVLGCDLHGKVVIDGTKVAADRAGLVSWPACWIRPGLGSARSW